MPVSRPIAVTLPAHGVAFAESIHGPGFRMPERADPFHKLIYVLQGRIGFNTLAGGEPLRAGAGATVCVQAGARHRITDAEPPTLLLLCFSPEFLSRDPALEQLWRTLTAGRPAALRPGHPGRVRFEGLWRAGIAEQAARRPRRGVAVRAVAANILVALARTPADQPVEAAAARVAAVTRELAATFYESWSLERACARAGISRRHFSKLFREQTGRTFLEQLTELRLSHAADLLREGRHSIIGAAFSSGYGDLSHFYRLFRQRFGQPPRAWIEKRHGAALRKGG